MLECLVKTSGECSVIDSARFLALRPVLQSAISLCSRLFLFFPFFFVLFLFVFCIFFKRSFKVVLYMNERDHYSDIIIMDISSAPSRVSPR